MSPDDALAEIALVRLRHDLNTPLTVVQARAQLVQRWLARHPALADHDRAYLEAAVSQVVAASREMGAAIEALVQVTPPAPARRRMVTHATRRLYSSAVPVAGSARASRSSSTASM